MALRFQQFTYTADKEEMVNGLKNGSLFSSMSIQQLGIQALPGTKFYINGSNSPVLVGFSGLFNLDLTDQGEITELRFDLNSLKYIKNANSILIIDIAYTGGDT